nr:MAG TPA: hypothetical protein [Caudoviricetes sp.]
MPFSYMISGGVYPACCLASVGCGYVPFGWAQAVWLW